MDDFRETGVQSLETGVRPLETGWLLKSIQDASWRVEIARALDNPLATLADIEKLVTAIAKRERSK